MPDAEKKILIIDDSADWVRLLTTTLQKEGYKIEVAFDAISAIRQALESNPNLIILDIRMPAGGGIRVLQNIRRSNKTFNLPVVVLTGVEEKEIRDEVEKLGVSGYLMKSADTGELLKKIKEVLV